MTPCELELTNPNGNIYTISINIKLVLKSLSTAAASTGTKPLERGRERYTENVPGEGGTSGERAG